VKSTYTETLRDGTRRIVVYDVHRDGPVSAGLTLLRRVKWLYRWCRDHPGDFGSQRILRQSQRELNLLSHAQKTSPQKLPPPKQGNARGTSKAPAPLVRPRLHLPLATPPSALTSRGLRDNANPAPNESAPGIHRPTTKNAQPRAADALPARRGAIGPLPRSGRR